MTLSKRGLVLGALIATLWSTSASMAASAEPTLDDVVAVLANRAAANEALSEFEEVRADAGMAGARAEVENCYLDANTLKKLSKCVLIDDAATLIDEAVSRVGRFPPTPFFTVAELGPRQWEAASRIISDSDLRTVFLSGSLVSAREAIERSIKPGTN